MIVAAHFVSYKKVRTLHSQDPHRSHSIVKSKARYVFLKQSFLLSIEDCAIAYYSLCIIHYSLCITYLCPPKCPPPPLLRPPPPPWLAPAEPRDIDEPELRDIDELELRDGAL